MNRKPFSTIDKLGHPSTARVELIYGKVKLPGGLDPKVARPVLLIESNFASDLATLSFAVMLGNYDHPEDGGLVFTFEGADDDRFVAYIRKTINWKVVPTRFDSAPDPLFEICSSVLHEGAEDASSYARYETSSLIHQRIMMAISEQYDFVGEIIVDIDQDGATMIMTHSDPDHGVNAFKLRCNFRQFDDSHVDEHIGLPPKPKAD